MKWLGEDVGSDFQQRKEQENRLKISLLKMSDLKEYSAEFMKFLSQLAAATGDLSSMTCPAFLLVSSYLVTRVQAVRVGSWLLRGQDILKFKSRFLCLFYAFFMLFDLI